MLEQMEPCKSTNISDIKNPHPCPFNGAVVCADQTCCARCGWNPKVAEKRLHKFKQKKIIRGKKYG